MTRLHEQIPVEPLGDARWERLERRLFDERDRELAAQRAPVKSARAGWRMAGFALGVFTGAAVAAVVLFVVLGGVREAGRGGGLGLARPVQIATGAGDGTRLTIGDAVVDVGAATEVAVLRGTDGNGDAHGGAGVLLVLAHGAVECEVAPRGERPPFLVSAGDVMVTVVGTHFRVERDAAVRVSVAHGRVRVATAGRGDTFVGAGESWASSAGPGDAVVHAAATGTTGTTGANPAVSPRTVGPATGSGSGSGPTTAPTGAGTGTVSAAGTTVPTASPPAENPRAREAEYQKARDLEADDLAGANRRFTQLAKGHDATAEKALYRLAVSAYEDKPRDLERARALAEEHARRFPAGAHAAGALFLRVRCAYDGGDTQSARDLAHEYLRRFPEGEDAEHARRIANW